jgi:hypothetical protein
MGLPVVHLKSGYGTISSVGHRFTIDLIIPEKPAGT